MEPLPTTHTEDTDTVTLAPCNNTSVGTLIVRDGQLLLIKRAHPPYGWAPPAGHVEDGETYRDAAVRETFEEVTLRVTGTVLRLIVSHHPNACRRPGGDWHRWEVHEATTEGDPARSKTETKAMRWVTAVELVDLANLTLEHLAADSGPEEWKLAPGLEPVWLDMLGLIGAAGGMTFALPRAETRTRG